MVWKGLQGCNTSEGGRRVTNESAAIGNIQPWVYFRIVDLFIRSAHIIQLVLFMILKTSTEEDEVEELLCINNVAFLNTCLKCLDPLQPGKEVTLWPCGERC